jgi:hypothetical protein
MLAAAVTACVDADADVDPLEVGLQTAAERPVLEWLDERDGLAAHEGFDATAGLATEDGLASGRGLMATAEGRTLVSYLVMCGLPAGRSIAKRDADGGWHRFDGLVGVAPTWEHGACDDACVRWVSACVLAHVNTAGLSAPLWIVADAGRQPQIGWGLDAAFPRHEASYFGDIFRSPPRMQYCDGRDVVDAPLPGRIGFDGPTVPFVNPWGKRARCASHCELAAGVDGASGARSCAGNDAVITVWRE